MTNIKFILGVILSLALALISIPSNAQVTISMEKKGNVFLIPGKINGIPLKFVFDTGASQVYLSLTEAQFMIKNGFLSYEDIKGLSQSQIANGEIVENLDVILKEIEIGGIILNNVEASISSNINAPLLLGQSAIQKLGPIKLNGNKLIIEDRINLPTLEKELAIYRKAYMLFCQGKYDQSLTESLEALSICGTSQTRGALYDNIAQVYEKKGNLDRAIEYERLAVSENPGYEQGLYNLGYMLYANNNLEEALQVFEQFILFFGENRTPKPKYLFAAYSYLGTIYAMKGRCKDAEQSFLKSVNLKCNQQACFGLADLYYEMERFDKAAVYLSQGISLNLRD